MELGRVLLSVLLQAIQERLECCCSRPNKTYGPLTLLILLILLHSTPEIAASENASDDERKGEKCLIKVGVRLGGRGEE